MTNGNVFLHAKTLGKMLFITLCILSFAFNSLAQTNTAAGTNIKNTATIFYSDGKDDFSTVSNEVVVTVARVSGLAIAPDLRTDSTVVAGQTSITKTFQVTNTGNITDLITFLSNGGSIWLTGPAKITAASIDGTDIFSNSQNVEFKVDQNGYLNVVVTLDVLPSAVSGDEIHLYLGDADSGVNFDNIDFNKSGHDVWTVAKNTVNGSREARGDINFFVESDALPRVNLTVPTGPVSLGSILTYITSVCNDGMRTLSGFKAGGIYVYAPIPIGTEFSDPGALPPGSQYTTDPLGVDPLSANWNDSPPSPLSEITRIRIPVAKELKPGQCSSDFKFSVLITTTTANNPIWEVVDAFGANSVGSLVTDQSGDKLSNTGDGNADFKEPYIGETAAKGEGFQLPTTLQAVGGVLNGPDQRPEAVGTSSDNDDFTNKSVTKGIANVAPGGVTTADNVVIFNNTLKNTGNVNDKFILTAPKVPEGFKVSISIDGGNVWFDVNETQSAVLPVNFGDAANYQVRIVAPAGIEVLTGYNTVIRATSSVDPKQMNDTIDRLYTGFIKADKSVKVVNKTGVGKDEDPVPGAELIYSITYTNISSVDGKDGNVILVASNLKIVEDGNLDANNWGSTTDQLVGSATDTNGGTIDGDTAGSSVLTDTIGKLLPQVSGTFTFTRIIK